MIRQIHPAVEDDGVRELDSRKNDGIEVTLLWNSRTDRVTVSVLEERYGVSFSLDVPPADALFAFHHPYAYATDDIDQAMAA